METEMEMETMETERRMTEATRPSEPMMRVPVFREMHTQQFRSFGKAHIFVSKYMKL